MNNLKQAFHEKQLDDTHVIYNGFGEAPDSCPRVQVIWFIVPGGKQPADWGRVIYCGNETEI